MTITVQHWLLLCLGAILGASLRFGISLYLNPISPKIALGVLAVNWLGCLLAGYLMVQGLPEPMKLMWIVGFLGSFTTFSAFGLDVADRLLAGHYGLALTIALAHTLGGVGCVWLGLWLGRLIN